MSNSVDEALEALDQFIECGGPHACEHCIRDRYPFVRSTLTAQQQRIEALEAALNRIAAWHDKQANEKLKDTGSYGGFDEPVAVKIARETLNQYRKQE